jgi:transposase InsO family protein
LLQGNDGSNDTCRSGRLQPQSNSRSTVDRPSGLTGGGSPLAALHQGLQPSVSRKGNCWDHAVAERFFHTLKTVLSYLEDFGTRGHAQTAVFEYIEVFYNRQRCHAADGYLAPLAYEQAFNTNGVLCPEKC